MIGDGCLVPDEQFIRIVCFLLCVCVLSAAKCFPSKSTKSNVWGSGRGQRKVPDGSPDEAKHIALWQTFQIHP